MPPVEVHSKIVKSSAKKVGGISITDQEKAEESNANRLLGTLKDHRCYRYEGLVQPSEAPYRVVYKITTVQVHNGDQGRSSGPSLPSLLLEEWRKGIIDNSTVIFFYLGRDKSETK